ncbi:GTP-binding protein EsdC [Apiospora rasikravindrae]|uniref:GTP-binding protein EsdC n=1 Tax=Apiospora rasikravindrae TaxID=990691 RepID=A0ABR1UC25_9PEZI
MATVQLSFSLRVSSGVKSVHLLGSWDNYVGQLPLSKDKSSSKSGSWKGTFRFQGNLEAGQRYWYYYIIDGYHVSHNPSEKSTVEPTTGRELNILDVPKDKSHKSSSSKSHSSSSSSSKSSSRHSSSSSSSSKDSKHRSSKRASLTVDIPKGRPLSTSQIKAPKPITPHATRHILDADYCDEDAIEELTARFGSADIDDDIVTDFSSSPVSSSGSSLSYRSDSSSPNSSLSGYSTPSSDCSNCTCERYGITRKGDRVKIDCGGARCGFSDDDSACSSSGDEEEYVSRSSRRNGIVVRS